jgi:hypothetical protein
VLGRLRSQGGLIRRRSGAWCGRRSVSLNHTGNEIAIFLFFASISLIGLFAWQQIITFTVGVRWIAVEASAAHFIDLDKRVLGWSLPEEAKPTTGVISELIAVIEHSVHGRSYLTPKGTLPLFTRELLRHDLDVFRLRRNRNPAIGNARCCASNRTEWIGKRCEWLLISTSSTSEPIQRWHDQSDIYRKRRRLTAVLQIDFDAYWSRARLFVRRGKFSHDAIFTTQAYIGSLRSSEISARFIERLSCINGLKKNSRCRQSSEDQQCGAYRIVDVPFASVETVLLPLPIPICFFVALVVTAFLAVHCAYIERPLLAIGLCVLTFVFALLFVASFSAIYADASSGGTHRICGNRNAESHRLAATSI